MEGQIDNTVPLIEPCEGMTFPYKLEPVMLLLPSAPVAALDIGAGTGVDAGWLAEQGPRVVSAEPTDAFRAFGAATHVCPRIRGQRQLASSDFA
jgi:hypothetical protein